jgi:hypothetical protein
MIRDDDAEATHHGRKHHSSQQASVYNGACTQFTFVSNIATLRQGPEPMNIDSHDGQQVSEEEGNALDEYVKRTRH